MAYGRLGRRFFRGSVGFSGLCCPVVRVGQNTRVLLFFQPSRGSEITGSRNSRGVDAARGQYFQANSCQQSSMFAPIFSQICPGSVLSDLRLAMAYGSLRSKI